MPNWRKLSRRKEGIRLHVWLGNRSIMHPCSNLMSGLRLSGAFRVSATCTGIPPLNGPLWFDTPCLKIQAVLQEVIRLSLVLCLEVDLKPNYPHTAHWPAGCPRSSEGLKASPEVRPRRAWPTTQENIRMIFAFLVDHTCVVRVVTDQIAGRK